MDLTSKGLRKPLDSESADVADLNFNADRINDYGMGAFLCTSGTRPASPWYGLVIHESDTNATLIWTDELTWRPISTIWCTAATRPSPVVVGQRIFETDTQKYYWWTGGAWVQDVLWVGATAARPPAIPSTGRQVFEDDTLRSLISWGGQWLPLQSVTKVDQYASGSTVANGTLIMNAVPLSAWAGQSMIVVEISGQVGFATAAVDAGITVVGTGLTLVQGSLNSRQVNAAAAKWAAFSHTVSFVLAGGSTAAAGLQLNTYSSGVSYYDICRKITRLPYGHYQSGI